MSSHAASFWRWSTLALLVFLSGCGGNGGGATPAAPVDPSSAYTGVRTQAVLDGNNANNIAFGALGGVTFGSNLQVSGTAAKAVPVAQKQTVQQTALALKQSVRRMNIPGAAAKQKAKAAAAPHSQPHKVVRRSDSFTLSGPSGGSASYSLNINDATGSFYGTVTYSQYSDGSTTVSGTAQILGTVDATGQELSNATISFRTLSITINQNTVILVGTLSWAYNYYESSDALTMNMVLIQNGKTYWFSNYQLTTTYGGTSLTQTINGRYYDPLYGYVDLTTPTPLVVNTGDSWPSQGDLQASGAPTASSPTAHTSEHLTFDSTTALVKADTDGDGVSDYQYSQQTNNQNSGGIEFGGSTANTPPVAVAGANQSVSQGSTVSLDGRASYDPNGDPLSYSWSFNSCPDNACPALSNADTATPSFVADSEGLYRLQLTVFDGQSASAPATMTVTSTVAPSDPGFKKLQWQYGTFGTSIGQAGMFTADLDGDGKQEIVTAGSSGIFGPNTFWYILRQNAGGGYDQVWRSENYGPILRLALADIDGNGQKDVVVGFADGTFLVYDGASHQKIRSLKVAGGVTDFALADLDGDGKMEIVATDGIGVFVYSAQTGTQKWSLASGGGSSIAVGNVDTDANLEIVTTSNGGKGYVIDAVTHALKWDYLNGFGFQVSLGDIDGDGKQEIVGASWNKITIFDVSRKTPVWENSVSYGVGSLLLKDTDGDGIAEIIYGENQGGNIHCLDGRTHAERWAVPSLQAGVSGIAFEDVDGDGKKELLWGSGGGSTGEDHLYIADPVSDTIKWQSTDFDGLSAVAVGDVDGDGRDEIVMVSQNSDGGYDSGIIFVFDAVSHALKRQTNLPAQDWSGTKLVRIGDVDDDGKNEIVVTTSYLYDGLIMVYDGATLAVKAQTAKYGGSNFNGLAIGDVDGDGTNEIVTSNGGNIIVFDGATMQEKWRTVQMGNIYDFKVADIDGDGHSEIVASISSPYSPSGGRLIVYDGVTQNLKLLVQEPARALEISDVDGDGVPDIVVGRDDGKIDVLDGKTFLVKKTVPTFSTSPVDALRLVDLDGDGAPEWIAASGGGLIILDGKSQGLKWTSGVLETSLGIGNHLPVKDTDGDGTKELFVGSASAIYQFQ